MQQTIGEYLIKELKKLEQVKEVRGRGLMIGIELPEDLSNVRKDLLFKHQYFYR
jgi:acetylornithine/N-succinyldiaminopimelate aminotransferase